MSWINDGDTGLSIRNKLNSIPNDGSNSTCLSKIVTDITTGASPVTLSEPFADVYVITSGGTDGVESIVLPGYASYADANVGKRVIFLEKTFSGTGDNPTLTYSYGSGSGAVVELGQYRNGLVSYTVECDGQYWRPIGWGAASNSGAQNVLITGYFAHAEGFLTTASGDEAHAEGEGTMASGDWSHAEGLLTIASGSYSHAENFRAVASGNTSHAEGGSTLASGIFSHAEGASTIASGDYSHAEGNSTEASGIFSHAEGYFSTTRGIRGAHVEASYRFTTRGDVQCMSVKLVGQTADATPMLLTADTGPASTNNQVTLPDNASYFCEITVTGKAAGLGDYFVKKFEVVIQRGSGAATTAIPTTAPTTPAVISTYATTGAISGSWSVALSADTTNGALAVTVTGAAATNINWLAEVRTRELVF